MLSNDESGIWTGCSRNVRDVFLGFKMSADSDRNWSLRATDSMGLDHLDGHSFSHMCSSQAGMVNGALRLGHLHMAFHMVGFS